MCLNRDLFLSQVHSAACSQQRAHCALMSSFSCNDSVLETWQFTWHTNRTVPVLMWISCIDTTYITLFFNRLLFGHQWCCHLWLYVVTSASILKSFQNCQSHIVLWLWRNGYSRNLVHWGFRRLSWRCNTFDEGVLRVWEFAKRICQNKHIL